MAEFFSMGGYAAYVWPAYGIAAVILVAMLVASLRGLRRHEALLKTLETSRPRRRRERNLRANSTAPATLPAAEGHEG
jgi:heme exporter protein D